MQNMVRKEHQNDENKRNIIINLNKFNREESFINNNDEIDADNQGLSSATLIRMYQSSNYVDPNKLQEISRMISILNKKLKYDNSFLDYNEEKLEFEIKKMLNEQSDFNDKNNDFEDFKSNNNYRLSSSRPRPRPPRIDSSKSMEIKDKKNQIVDMIKEKKTTYKDIQLFKEINHKRIQYLNKNIPKVEKHQFLTNDQRFFRKNFCTM
jgi:hypothetical protein